MQLYAYIQTYMLVQDNQVWHVSSRFKIINFEIADPDRNYHKNFWK